MNRQSALLRLLEALSRVEAHNRLMASPDRDLAISMLFMSGDERESILCRIAPAKAARVRDEISLQERLQIRQDHYEATLEGLLVRIGGATRAPIVRSYIRPRRRR